MTSLLVEGDCMVFSRLMEDFQGSSLQLSDAFVEPRSPGTPAQARYFFLFVLLSDLCCIIFVFASFLNFFCLKR